MHVLSMPPFAQIIKAEMVLWTAGFVLLTLVINAPMLPYVLRWTGLNKGASVPHLIVLCLQHPGQAPQTKTYLQIIEAHQVCALLRTSARAPPLSARKSGSQV